MVNAETLARRREILLRGREPFLAGAAVLEMIEQRLQIGLRNRDDGGSFGGVWARGGGARETETGCGKGENAAGRRLAISAGVFAEAGT